MKKVFQYFLLFVACLALFTYCSNLKEVKCSGITDFKLKKIDISGIEAEIELGIKNPNALGFSIYRSKFDVSLNGVYLGKAKSSRRVHVGPNSDKSYRFTLKGSFKDMGLQDVMKFMGVSKASLEVKGNIKAGKFFIKKRIPIDARENVGL